ncbi:Gfo/Idh/MocA family protein [Streptomyces longisporus]|uniref:Gfo/Idh/MocA family protein n=1 Tax=Streptomyces longisporus TaxID=1948 RepID=UPI003CD0740F
MNCTQFRSTAVTCLAHPVPAGRRPWRRQRTRERGRVVGLLSCTAERSLAAAERWQVDVGYPDLDAVLSDDTIDVVHVSPQPPARRSDCRRLRAGKHVVCEKAVATIAADAQLLVDAAESAGRIVTVPFIHHYHPMVREFRTRIAASGFGAWQLLNGHTSRTGGWIRRPASPHGRSPRSGRTGSTWSNGRPGPVAELLTETTATVADRPHVGGPAYGQGALRHGPRHGHEGERPREPSHRDSGERPERTETPARDPSANSPDAARLSVVPAGHPQGYPECFVGPPHFGVLGPQPLDPRGLPGRDAGPPAGVDFSLPDPGPHRLSRTDTQLRRACLHHGPLGFGQSGRISVTMRTARSRSSGG